MLSTTIDKYLYISCRKLPPFFNHRLRLVYGRIEECDNANELLHPSARETLKYLGLTEGLEIHYDGDLPAMSGMGSSSSFTVGMLNALYQLKNIGISHQKSLYIMGLADYFNNNGKKIDFKTLSDIEVCNELIKLKGIGQWTIDMFLMFTLHRLDIFPVSDLGIQKGIKILFKMSNLPSKQYMIQKSKPWKPYRTIACHYLWCIVDDDIVW